MTMPAGATGAGASAAARLPVTVAVCTYGRPVSLGRTLDSLLSQNPAAEEVLVVNNGPDHAGTEELLRRNFPQVRCVNEIVPGLDFARNTALEAARHDVVLFIDDDAVAGDGWVAAAARPLLDDPRVGASTGRVEPFALETAAQQLFEANGGFSRGSLRIRLPADARGRLHRFPAPLIAWTVSVGSGCSLALRRDVARSHGGVDRALDLRAALPGGGEQDMRWRM
jgi:glycosyltransferase involved in cell wall biosynthesis